MGLKQCPKTGLLLPSDFNDQREYIKDELSRVIEETINENQHIEGRYFIVFHGKFHELNPEELDTKVTVTRNLPRFITNQIVFYIDNRRGLSEWLWTVTPDRKVEFNTEGVAYLQAKEAMPRCK